MKHYRVAMRLILASLCALAACDSGRLNQFSTFAAAGTQYVQNFRQVTAQAGTAMIAVDSAVYVASRDPEVLKMPGKATFYESELKQSDQQLKDYLATLQLLDSHASKLGAYLANISALTSSSNVTNIVTAANSDIDALNKLNAAVENASLSVGKVNIHVKDFVQPVTKLIVEHFEVKALNENLRQGADTVDQALSLQEAAVAALEKQLKASLESSLADRETTDVLIPYVGTDPSNPWNPAKWTSNREAYVRAKVTVDSVGSAKTAITQLHIDFRLLVENKSTDINFETLLDDVNKMTSYVNALQSTSSGLKAVSSDTSKTN